GRGVGAGGRGGGGGAQREGVEPVLVGGVDRAADVELRAGDGVQRERVVAVAADVGDVAADDVAGAGPHNGQRVVAVAGVDHQAAGVGEAIEVDRHRVAGVAARDV